jgi:NitT/TauT family transport system substrate-binding protein
MLAPPLLIPVYTFQTYRNNNEDDKMSKLPLVVLHKLAVSVGGAALLSASLLSVSLSVSAAPEAGEFKMGTLPWLGYGQWYVADHEGLFKKAGLEKVSLVNFTEDKDINAALASGQIDAANVATHTAMAMISAGLPVKAVLLLDRSMTADALMVGPNIKSMADLKGQSVAFEEGTTSDILLHSALSAAHMKWTDIKPVPMPAANAGSALIAKQVAAAVTYEPYLTLSKKQDPSVSMLYSGKDDPGLISDVLLVSDTALKNKPEQIRAMVKVWDQSLQHYNTHTDADRDIIAKAVGATSDELKTAFEGVTYYSLQDNKTELHGAFIKETYPHVLKAATDAGLIPQPVQSGQVFDTSFVDGL